MTSAIDIERRLRARYRQPAGVEQFGIEPVPEERKTAGWFDLFSFNFFRRASGCGDARAVGGTAKAG